MSIFHFSVPLQIWDNQLCFSIVRRTDKHARTFLNILTRLWANMSNLITAAYVTKPFFETTSDSLCPQRERWGEKHKHKHQLQGKAIKSRRCVALLINIFKIDFMQSGAIRSIQKPSGSRSYHQLYNIYIPYRISSEVKWKWGEGQVWKPI